MGSNRATKNGTTRLPAALLIPERCQASALAAVGATAADSSYTQAGPRPGHAIPADAYSQMRVEISHSQGTDIDVRALKAGHPRVDGGAQLAIKKDSEAATAWRGWDSPMVLCGWEPVDWGDFKGSGAYDLATIPSTQEVLVVYRALATDQIESALVGVTQGVELQTGTIAGVTSWNDPMVLILPESERALCFTGNRAYYSDDKGDTWSQYSQKLTEETITNYGRSVVARFGSDMMMLVENTASTDVHHLVSTDYGATFELLKTYTTLGTSVDIHTNADGIHVIYDDGTNLVYRKLASVFEELDFSTAATIEAGTGRHATIAGDAAGSLWVFDNQATGTSTGQLFESKNAGQTWDGGSANQQYTLGTGADTLEDWRSCYALGRVVTLQQFFDNAVEQSANFGVGFWGEWSNSSLQRKLGGLDVLGRGSYSSDGSTRTGYIWLPHLEPVTWGPWVTSGAGTATLSGGKLNISTSGNTKQYTETLGTTEVDAVFFRRVQVTTGGSTSAAHVGVRLRLTDNSAYLYELMLYLKTDTITGYDVGGSAQLFSDALDMATDYVDIRAWIDNAGNVVVASRAVGSSTWTTHENGQTLTNGTPSANGEIRWGNLASATAVSNWKMGGHASDTGTKGPILKAGAANLAGKTITARPEPVPDMGDGTNVARLAMVAGPARYADTASIPAFYEHGIEQLHSEIGASPKATMRTTDLTEYLQTYDLESEGWLGHSIALVAINCNFRTCYLESSADGSAWDTEETLDLADGFTGLRYTLTGDIMYPDTANTTAADRWLWEQELRGAWVQAIGSGPTVKSTRILSQSTGGWSPSSSGTTVLPMLELDDPTDIAALGGTPTAALVWSSGLIIHHPTAPRIRRYWRIRIASGTAGEATPKGEGYYEAGVLQIMRVAMLGWNTDWGDRDEAIPNVDMSRDSSGTTRALQRGDDARRWSLGWASSPTNQKNLRDDPNADYMGPTSGLANVGADDVFHRLRGLSKVVLGGQLPVVALKEVPNATGTIITDPSRWLYGRRVGSVSAVHSSGQSVGEDEVLRPDSITIEEIP